MLRCPTCDNTLDQDFGMVTCTECKAVLMIDISGEVQVGVESPQSFEDHEDDFEEVTQNTSSYDPMEDDLRDEMSRFSVDSFEEADDIESVEDLDKTSEFTASSDSIYDSDPDSFDSFENNDFEENFEDTNTLHDSTEETAPALISALAPSVEEEFPEDLEDASEAPERSHADNDEEEPPLETFEMAEKPDTEPLDITDFANSEASNLEDGELLYDLYLSRLDSKDLRDAFKFVLLDEKLKLNHHEYLKNIRNGRVTISNLNPIKAKRIVEQLQYTAIDISWKQKRVTVEVVEAEPVTGGTSGGVEDVEI